MAYISVIDNRHYVSLEQQFGAVSIPATSNRVPLQSMDLSQRFHIPKRKDKSGSRSFIGSGAPLREEARFHAKGYLYPTTIGSTSPVRPLIEAAMGGPTLSFNGGLVDSALDSTHFRFVAPHGLAPGQALSFGGELRFVRAIVDPFTVETNAPYTQLPGASTTFGPTTTFTLGRDLPSISLFDYWGGQSGLHRIATGAVVDVMKVGLNGDFHDLEFQGPASRILDSASFAGGMGGLSVFPDEPAIQTFGNSPVPGHLGQVWFGSTLSRFHSVTGATARVSNNVAMRTREFGSVNARAFVPGERSIGLKFSIFQEDTTATRDLYLAARSRLPIQVMLQLGQQATQLLSVYMKSVVPVIPSYDEGDARVEWTFEDASAQGQADDELYIAIG